MEQRSPSHHRAATAAAYERINDNRHINSERFIREYEPGDETDLVYSLGIPVQQAQALADDLKRNAKLGTAYVAYNKGKIIALGGVAKLREGLGEAWSQPNDRIYECPRFYFDTIRWGVMDGIIRLNLRRIQTLCSRGDTTSYDWQKRMGFELEGVMQAYNDDGSDAVRMGMICQKATQYLTQE